MGLFNELWQATKDSLLARATPELTAYVTYFERQWIASRWCNWQRGSMAAGYSVTNNPVESENADIKRTYLRAMVVLSDVLTGLTNMTNHESRDQKPAELKKHFCSTNELNDIRRKAERLAVERNYFVQEGDLWRVSHTGRAGNRVVPALQDVVLRVKQYKVRPGNNTDDTGSCSCPCFMDKLVCKHVLALRLHLGIVRVLPAVRRARAGKPRKRRRRALEYQTSSEEESEGEDK